MDATAHGSVQRGPPCLAALKDASSWLFPQPAAGASKSQDQVDMALPASAKARVVRSSADGPLLALEHISVPDIGPGQALVRVDHVAQNPTDGKLLHALNVRTEA